MMWVLAQEMVLQDVEWLSPDVEQEIVIRLSLPWDTKTLAWGKALLLGITSSMLAIRHGSLG